jgi:hypothetical protein
MIPKDCKRLAEVDFPIAEVSRHAAREKSIRHGHPSTLHLWWARRPLASSRASPLCVEERRMANDRPGCFWLYIVTDYDNAPRLQEPIRDPARLGWHEVTKVPHYYLSVDAMTRPMMVHEDSPPYGGKRP